MPGAVRSAPPNITKFNPAHIQRPQPTPAALPPPSRTAQAPTPLKERSHASSTAAQIAPLAPLTTRHEELSGEIRQVSGDVIHSEMMLSDISRVLQTHGCENLSDRLDPLAYSTFPLFNGGLGDVYSGELDGAKVAIKMTRLHVVNQTGRKHLKHAAKELHTWSKCQHPNVLGLLGFVEFRGQIGMVSKWLENGNCYRISDGLAYLHDIEIIHGDLKGANVLIDGNGTPMLADFGNRISPRWTAPEILDGSTSYSYAADVYALGMEVITGLVPFRELQRDQAVYTAIVIKNEIPKRPEACIPRQSRDGDALWSLLNQCWAYEPGKRPLAKYVQAQIKWITREGLRDSSGRVYSGKRPDGSD
ncbi:kinase-like domain-containing protein [Rhizoctonia solani]|nr:kinase-like domain-containing protein [Rhizoctonia solani]